MEIPGFSALHRTVTPTCRTNRGDTECVAEVRDDVAAKLAAALAGWPTDSVHVHVAITIEQLPT